MQHDTEKYDFTVVEKIVHDALEKRVFPSANIIIANNSKILFENAYGTLSYDDKTPTQHDTIYDCASLTKVIVTTSIMMKLYEEGKYKLEDPIIKYIPELNNNDKEDITILNILIHNSGLRACTSFHEICKERKEVLEYIYNSKKDYETGTKTVYSDYGFILIGELVERLTGEKLDVYAQKHLFDPLQMTQSWYKPSEDLLPRIAPTEVDDYWRMKVVRGTVHDETCDILGGVTGHAGLFSIAKDVYKYFNMLLNNGVYHDKDGKECRLLKEETVKLFTTCWTEGINYENTRALGFDTKPNPPDWGPQCGYKFSKNSFGHTGFTGTSAWADKEKNIIVIALTNAVHPSRHVNRRALFDFRTTIHDEICKCMGY